MNRTQPGLKRRAPRLPIRLPGTLKARVPRPVTVVDMSLTGFLMQCPTPLDPGSIHDLSLTLSKDPFSAKARVTECSLDGTAGGEESPRYLVGLQFLGLPAREEAQLRRFLAEEKRRRQTGH